MIESKAFNFFKRQIFQGSAKPENRAERDDPAEIVSKARKKSHLSLDLGNAPAAREELENGLDELRSKTPSKDDLSWLSGKIQILGDLERYHEGQELVNHLDSLDGGLRVVRRSMSESTDDLDDADEKYRTYLEWTHQKVAAAVHVHHWDKAKEIAKDVCDLEDQYSDIDVDDPMARFEKCAILLHGGIAAEEKARTEITRGDNAKAIEEFEQALRFYNWGCHVSNIYHEYFDNPVALITGLDHENCANLFFSAARVCLEMDNNAGVQSPREFKYQPSLKGADWKHQALTFLEMGKARALLETLAHNETQNKSQESKFTDLPTVVKAIVVRDRVNKRREEIRKRRKLQNRHEETLEIRSPLGTEPSKENRPESEDEREVNSATQKEEESGKHFDKQRLKSISIIIDLQDRVKKVLNPELCDALSLFNNWTDLLKAIPKNTLVFECTLASAPRAQQGISIFIMTSERIEVAVWRDIDSVELKGHIKNLRCAMETKVQRAEMSRQMDPPQNTDPGDLYEKAQEYLSHHFLREFRKLFHGKKHLVIIPSGELTHIPWTMLPPEEPLVENHTVTVVPSFSIWYHFFKKHGRKMPNSDHVPKLSVVTNKPRNRAGAFHGKIPFAKIEALHIAQLHGTKPFLADDSPREELQKYAQDCQVIHISAHGDFDPQSPLDSKIYLFQDYLSVRHLKDLQLDNALVIFSACLSGFSHSLDSGSAFSFAHTLISAGARSFIGSLWPVSDAGTLLLMMLFYEKLYGGASPAAALHAAQKAMRNFTNNDLHRLVGKLRVLDTSHTRENYVRNMKFRLDHDLLKREAEDFRAPQYWAGFVLTGYGDVPIYHRRPTSKLAATT